MYEAEITELISKNLPAHVGEILRKRLTDAVQAEKDRDALKIRVEELLKLKLKAYHLDARANSLDRHQKDIEASLIKHAAAIVELEKRVAVQTCREEMTKQMLQQNFDVVNAVFANSKYKYMKTETDNVAVPGSSTDCGFVS